MNPVTVTSRSIRGTLRSDIDVDGRHRLVTDEPVDLGGEDTAPTPHELLPAALAACISTTLVMYARRKEWDLGEVSVEVRYDAAATPRRFDVAIELGGDLDAEQLERLEKIAASCPVGRSLEAGVELTERIVRPAIVSPA